MVANSDKEERQEREKHVVARIKQETRGNSRYTVKIIHRFDFQRIVVKRDRIVG